jgi:hypothetical protein
MSARERTHPGRIRNALPYIQYRRATMSVDGIYRYDLERRWNDADEDSPLVLWCMLNPSTADGLVDDATIRRCIGFTDSWGFGRLVVVNLYAYRATNPKVLRKLTTAERFGANYSHLQDWIQSPLTRIFVCAWGNRRIDPFSFLIRDATRYALAYTKRGEPSHPLYLPADSQLKRIP